MIFHERHYAAEQKRLINCISQRSRLLRRLNGAQNSKEIEAQVDELQRQAELITRHMKDYVGLLTGRVAAPDLDPIFCVPVILIRARIALGWSPKELARRLNVGRTQVSRWESTNYASTTFATVEKIAKLLKAELNKQNRNPALIGKPLKLGCDWHNSDFRNLDNP